MTTRVTPTEVTIDYSPRGPQIVRATDDTAGDQKYNDNKYHSRGDASLLLLEQVSAKILAHRRNGTTIELTIDNDGQHIIEDTAPAASAASPQATAATSPEAQTGSQATVAPKYEGHSIEGTIRPEAKPSSSDKKTDTRKPQDKKPRTPRSNSRKSAGKKRPE
jgi:hypothetical protein